MPIYLNDSIMPIYRYALLFSIMLAFASIIAGIGYSLFTYIQTDLSISSAAYEGLLLFLKGAGVTALISFLSFLAFWKRHQISFQNCQEKKPSNCHEIGFFNFA